MTSPRKTTAQLTEHDAGSDHPDPIEKLVQRALKALGPPHDGAAALSDLAFAKRLVAVLIALHVIREHHDHDKPHDRAAGRTDVRGTGEGD